MAAAQAKADRLKREAEMDYDLDKIAMQNMDKTWKESKEEGKFKNEPIDANNHTFDAATYGAYTHLTKNGYKK